MQEIKSVGGRRSLVSAWLLVVLFIGCQTVPGTGTNVAEQSGKLEKESEEGSEFSWGDLKNRLKSDRRGHTVPKWFPEKLSFKGWDNQNSLPLTPADGDTVWFKTTGYVYEYGKPDDDRAVTLGYFASKSSKRTPLEGEDAAEWKEVARGTIPALNQEYVLLQHVKEGHWEGEGPIIEDPKSKGVFLHHSAIMRKDITLEEAKALLASYDYP